VWLYDEVRNQVDDGVMISSSQFMLDAKDCYEEDVMAVTLVVLYILEIEFLFSLLHST